MKKTPVAGYAVFVIVIVLTFYGLGASAVDHYVIYPTFRLIGENEFVAYRAVFGPRIILFLVVPMVLHTVFTVLLLWRRPAAIPLWAVLSALACHVVRWLSTVLIQIPIQFQLSKGKNIELIDTLTRTGHLRTLANLVLAAIVVWMMFAVFRFSQEASSETQD